VCVCFLMRMFLCVYRCMCVCEREGKRKRGRRRERVEREVGESERASEREIGSHVSCIAECIRFSDF